jgi:hypothetical protein
MTEQPSIDQLPEMLGFVETTEMSQLRENIAKALKCQEDATELLTRYHLLGEAVADSMDHARARIGLIVQMGLICRDGGLVDDARQNLKDAYAYALNTNMVAAQEILTEPLLDYAVAGLKSLNLDSDDLVAAVYAEATDLGIPDPEGYLRAQGLLGE